MSGFGRYYMHGRDSNMTLRILSQVKPEVKTAAPAGEPVMQQLKKEDDTLAGSGAPRVNSGSKAPPASEGSSAGTRPKRKASELDDGWHVILSIPTHTTIMSYKSLNFAALLDDHAAGGSIVIDKKAVSDEALTAIMAVLQHMYVESMPLYCTAAVFPSEHGPLHNISLVSRLIETIMIACEWEVPLTIQACFEVLRSLGDTAMSYRDCSALVNLSHELAQLPGAASIMARASQLLLDKTIVYNSTAPQPTLAALQGQLSQLPHHVRLSMLNSNRLGYLGMKGLLSSDEHIAESEDMLAVVIAQYLDSSAGRVCTPAQIEDLLGQLRYPNMSNSFVAHNLSSLNHVRLNKQQLAHLIGLRGLQGFESIPLAHRQPGVPEAWYKAARIFATPQQDTFTLELKVMLPVFMAHLKAAGAARSGSRTLPDNIKGPLVVFRGFSWGLVLQSPAPNRQIMLGATANPVSGIYSNSGARRAGVYAEITFRLECANPVITLAEKYWVGIHAAGVSNFPQGIVQREGSPSEISWWRDYIKDGCITFTATVKCL